MEEETPVATFCIGEQSYDHPGFEHDEITKQDDYLETQSNPEYQCNRSTTEELDFHDVQPSVDNPAGGISKEIKMDNDEPSKTLLKNHISSRKILDISCSSEPNLSQKKVRQGSRELENIVVNDNQTVNDKLLTVNGNGLSQSPLHKSAPQLTQWTVHLQEVAPGTTQIHDGSRDWTFQMDWFSSKKRGKKEGDRKLPKSVRHYYKAQDELITAFETIRLADEAESEDTLKRLAAQKKLSSILAKVTFFLNLLLLIAKLVASILSGSLSVISSLVDSAVDLLSGIIIWWTARAIKKRDPYTYPEGRTQLEPVGLIILSVIMSVAAVQLVIVSVQRIVDFATSASGNSVVVDVATIVIVCFTIVTKLVMWLICRRVPTPSMRVLSVDHRNDVLSNTVALIMGFVGATWWEYADPMGAILISLYIAFSWYQQGWQQIKLLTGVTARPEFLKRITWLCLDHSSKIQHIETVRAFHFGTNFIVEVDIVLPETMTLKEAHDIGEPLQQKLEKLPEVERAFVHLDYEFEHSPYDEHKKV